MEFKFMFGIEWNDEFVDVFNGGLQDVSNDYYFVGYY